MTRLRFLACCVAVICGQLAFFDSATGAAPVDFAHDVLPILQKHCAKCHTNGRYEGDISFDSREAILEGSVAEPGQSADSSIIARLIEEDPELRMPLEAPPLSADEIDVLRRWIDGGLPWQEGFSFKKESYEPPLKPRRPDLPPATNASANPIDRIVQAYWQEHGITAPKPLTDAAFYRRASLDLVGLLPRVEEVRAFEADTSPDKRVALVHRLLDDRVAYADHWLSFWNDLLRNEYVGVGYISGGRRQITSWLYRALLDNKPYDQFVRELVNPKRESEGFAKGIVWRGEVNASQRPALQYAQNVGQVFLGVNLKCASCHDSFIDHWKLTDAYGLAAIFSADAIEIHRCDVPTGETAKPYFLFSELGNVDAKAPREERMATLAALMTSSENGRLTRTIVNRLWDRMMGRGIVFPVDALASRPWSEDLLDFLAVDLSDHGYDLKYTLALIATSQLYNSASVATGRAGAEDYVFAGPGVKRLTAEQFVDAVRQTTGTSPKQTAEDEIFAEMLYYASRGTAERPFVRSSLVAPTLLLRTLGRPNREQVVSTRPAEMTTLEAIEMSNGQPLAELLDEGASQLLAAHPDWSSQEICEYVFHSATSRTATPDELAKLVTLAGERPTPESVSDVLWSVFMLPEVLLVR